jgi:hypothetical protein
LNTCIILQSPLCQLLTVGLKEDDQGKVNARHVEGILSITVTTSASASAPTSEASKWISGHTFMEPFKSIHAQKIGSLGAVQEGRGHGRMHDVEENHRQSHKSGIKDVQQAPSERR